MRRSDIIRAYHLGIVRKAEIQHRTERLRLGKLDRTEFVDVVLPPHSPVVGQRVADVDWPEECVLVSIRRGREVIIPHGTTILRAGDHISFFLDRREKEALYRCLGMWNPQEVRE